jgi:hypothetical protein
MFSFLFGYCYRQPLWILNKHLVVVYIHLHQQLLCPLPFMYLLFYVLFVCFTLCGSFLWGVMNGLLSSQMNIPA